MKSFQFLLLSAVVSLFAAGCAPKSQAAAKVEKSIDDLKSGIEANTADCKKMTAAMQDPAANLIAGLKEIKEKNESLPATTKLKFAGLTASFQKMGPCAKSPEMEQLLSSLVTSAGMR